MKVMKREFPYITVGKILKELYEEGLPVARVTFARLEKRLNLPQPKRTSGAVEWRIYSREQADEIKKRIKEEYTPTDGNTNYEDK